MAERILIVEDEEKLARFVELELMHEGYAVDKAFDGRDGLGMAEANDYDLLLLDIMLPGLSGLELLRRLRAIAQDEQILQNEPLAAHTTMRVGGPADVFFLPDSAAQVCRALDVARELGLPALLMGNGSNLIVRDGGVRALVICLGERFARVDIDGEEW